MTKARFPRGKPKNAKKSVEQLVYEANKAVEAAAEAANAETAEKGLSERDVLMWQLREAQAELWGAVDKFSVKHHDLATGGAKDPASLKVRARSATGVLVVFDDGATYFADRRLGGLSYRPYMLEFDHSDPRNPGTVEEAIKFRTRDDSDVKAS